MDEREILEGLKASCNADNAALVSRDGLTLVSSTKQGVSAETFSIMCATILGAAVTTTSELAKGEPEIVHIESPDSKVIIAGAGKRALIVMSVPTSTNLDLLRGEIDKAVDEFKSVL